MPEGKPGIKSERIAWSPGMRLPRLLDKMRRMKVAQPSTVDPLDLVPRSLGHKKSRRWPSIAECAICAASVCVPLALIGVIDFRCYQPSWETTTTIDLLVAELPETLKFAVVDRGGSSYVVWIGRSRGAIVSGPPVYVFDATGVLVDRTSDAGDSDNRFVLGLYSAAYAVPEITAQEAVDYCHQKRAASN
jgi:hypothetical protein